MAGKRERGHAPRDEERRGSEQGDPSREGAPPGDPEEERPEDEREEVEVEVSPIELLSALARLDLEVALAYETAAELSRDGELARQLTRFAGDHRRHADALNRVLEREGDPAVAIGGTAGVPVLPGVMKLAGPLGPEVIVVALLGNEQLTNLGYDAALAYAWGGDVETMLEGFAADEQRHLAWLVERHDRLSGHARESDRPAT